MPLKSALLAGVLLAYPLPAWAQDTQVPAFGIGDSAARSLTVRPVQPARSAAASQPSGTPFLLERAKPAEPDAAAEPDQPGKEIDISALRYYAGQNDLARVAAEIRLLRAKHPAWEPPADLFTEVRNTVDEQPLWDLFAKHDLAGLKAAVDEIRTTKPDWQPSSDLTQKVQLAEAHDTLVAASDAQRWSDVLDVAAGTQGLLTCADVDALWRTAEALVRTGDETRAVDAYKYVLANCSKPQERLATVQKAGALLTMPGAIDGLISLGRRGRDGRSEFESLRLDAVRRTIGDAAAGKTTTQPAAKDIESLESAYAGSKDVADAQLLGWYYYAQKNFARAELWFRAGLDAKPNPKCAEGLVLALRGAGKLQEAATVALANRDLDTPNRRVFIELASAVLVAPTPPVAMTPEMLDAFVKAVDADQSASGAQAFGWHLYAAKDVAGAETWFRKSMGWTPSEDAAVGLMITAKRLKHEHDYVALVAQYRATYPRVAELETALRPRGGSVAKPTRVASRAGSKTGRRGASGGGQWDATADAIVSTFKAGQYDQALAMLDARQSRKAEPQGLSVVRGWAQYHRGDWAGAQQTFGALEKRAPSGDSETGLRVIGQGYLPPIMR